VAEAGVAGRAAEPPASSGLHQPLDQQLLAVCIGLFTSLWRSVGYLPD
jgi:hypothetical protein